MTMLTSHILCAIIAGLIGIWIGRRTNFLSTFIKGQTA